MNKIGSTRLSERFSMDEYTENPDDLEVRYAEEDVERNLAKFSAAVDELNQKISYTASRIRRPKEKFLEVKSWVTAPEHRKQVILGGLAIAGTLIVLRQWRSHSHQTQEF